MSRIRDRDSGLEIAFRKALWKLGYRYRKNPRGYKGKPDVLLKSRKTVVFIDSCFWHGCKKHCRMPGSRKEYWETKIQKNIKRDKEVTTHYKKMGWLVYRYWEHDLTTDFDRIIAEWRKKANLTPEEWHRQK